MTVAAPRVAFVGFGALASSFATGFRMPDGPPVKAYARPRANGRADGRLEAAGVVACTSIPEAVEDVDVVVAGVPAGAAEAVAHECMHALGAGALYVDPSPLDPGAKERLSVRFAEAGAEYVDAAVLGTVETEGFRVPLLVSGPGAARFAQTVEPLGFVVSVIDGPAGRSSLVKLLRSVFTKGRDALILEMLLAARRYDLESVVLESFTGKGESVTFPELATRVLGSLALYADRRAAELETSAEVLAAGGVDPIMTQAGATRLRRMGQLELRTRFGNERPGSLAEVLDALDGLR
jgi:3-hydroxyisobutyrate dehydrogenase-like beta-hydroxyacid dehydrogenase